MAIVYRHIRKDTNNVFYIGIGKDIKRAYHIYDRNKYWKNIINKTEYEIEIIAQDLSWEDACELEIFLIQEYGRKDLGLGTLVNLTDGGEGTLNKSESGKMNIKLANSKPKSNEHKDKMRQAKIGTKRSKESIKKQSENKSKQIIDIITGIEYPSAEYVAHLFGLKKNTLSNKLNDNFPRCKNNTNFRYKTI